MPLEIQSTQRWDRQDGELEQIGQFSAGSKSLSYFLQTSLRRK